MRNVTSVLSEEHQNILKVIDVVLHECGQIEQGKTPNIPFFQEVVYFIKKYADGFHHAKEEDILFKAMLNNMENMHCNPIPVMLHEHDEGRQYVKELEEALVLENTKGIVENAKGYAYLLQNHIHKEDNILYPMAEEALSDSEKQQVDEMYKTIKTEDFFQKDIQAYISGLSQNI